MPLPSICLVRTCPALPPRPPASRATAGPGRCRVCVMRVCARLPACLVPTYRCQTREHQTSCQSVRTYGARVKTGGPPHPARQVFQAPIKHILCNVPAAHTGTHTLVPSATQSYPVTIILPRLNSAVPTTILANIDQCPGHPHRSALRALALAASGAGASHGPWATAAAVRLCPRPCCS